MQVKISKTLEGIIARAAFNTTKAGIDHSLKDFLMLEMLREEGSLAYQLLSSRLKDWELYQVRLRIEREVLGAGRRENTGAEEFYRAFTDELCAVSGAVRSVSTAHALRAIVGDRSTATSRVLEMYGITGEVVSEDIKKSPPATISARRYRYTCSISARKTNPKRKTHRTCSTSSA